MAHTHVAGSEASDDIVSASEAAQIFGVNTVSIYMMKYRGFISSPVQLARGKGAWRSSCVQGFSKKEIRAVLDGSFQDLNLEGMNDDQLWQLIKGNSSR
jgi:hypothetical protein